MPCPLCISSQNGEDAEEELARVKRVADENQREQVRRSSSIDKDIKRAALRPITDVVETRAGLARLTSEPASYMCDPDQRLSVELQWEKFDHWNIPPLGATGSSSLEALPPPSPRIRRLNSTVAPTSNLDDSSAESEHPSRHEAPSTEKVPVRPAVRQVGRGGRRSPSGLRKVVMFVLGASPASSAPIERAARHVNMQEVTRVTRISREKTPRHQCWEEHWTLATYVTHPISCKVFKSNRSTAPTSTCIILGMLPPPYLDQLYGIRITSSRQHIATT